MEWIRRRSSASSPVDELTLAKAAAWAWHQRGSSGSDRPESDLRKHVGCSSGGHNQRRPSRYKLEAALAAAAAVDLEEEQGPAVSLLDMYEMERITRELDRLVMASGVGGRRARGREEASACSPPAGEARLEGRKASRLWGRHAAVMCGAAAGDVVMAATPVVRRRGKASAPLV